jgi:hypothetical protein
MIEINKQQVAGAIRLTMTASGPFAAIIMTKMQLTQSDYQFYLDLTLAFLPGAIAMVWSWYRNRSSSQIKAVSKLEDVATVVVKDSANGSVERMALSENHPNVVTETQNERDAKNGTKV